MSLVAGIAYGLFWQHQLLSTAAALNIDFAAMSSTRQESFA